MIEVLANAILPVFAIMVLGFVMGRAGWTSGAEARALNRFAFLVLQPALIISLISGLDLSAINGRAMLGYVAAQWLLFAVGFCVARFALKREPREAVLLAMALIFVNTLLYIGPIARLIYGEAAALPVTAVVAWDAAFSFAAMIIVMEVMRPAGRMAVAARRIATNPILLAILGGMAFNLAGLPLPRPVATFTGFAGAAAAPATLFAIGVILSASPLRPDRTVAVFVALKLGALPALVWLALSLCGITGDWSALLLLCAAGPSGAMAFALALLYDVRTDAIARVIIWTSLLSLLPMALLA